MCTFFSAISDGRGKVLFFTEEEIGKIMAEGNPKQYNPNSHTSIADYNGIKGAEEDKWNKWEYDVNTKVLKLDNKNTIDDRVIDDRVAVKKVIEKFLKGKDTGVLRNLYGLNTGYRNTGNSNTGDSNTGDSNTGYSNTGDSNTGDSNTGNSNTGYSNTGDSNTGNSNTGYSNTGDRNTGNSNTGNWNKCNKETGFFNSKSPETVNIFNKPCKLSNWENAKKPNFIYFDKNIWITSDEMTNEQKKAHPEHTTTGGCLTILTTEEAWDLAWFKATKEDKELLLKLPNFNAEVFRDITGIDVTKG